MSMCVIKDMGVGVLLLDKLWLVFVLRQSYWSLREIWDFPGLVDNLSVLDVVGVAHSFVTIDWLLLLAELLCCVGLVVGEPVFGVAFLSEFWVGDTLILPELVISIAKCGVGLFSIVVLISFGVA